MIEKKIHYCWFGGKELPELAKKCIASWKKYCPDYEIIEWNENNYDLCKNEYVKYTYEHKLYAFLTDYVRLDVVYEEGGIYLDTDVELLKPIDDLLSCKAFMGMEAVGQINTGLIFGAIRNHPFIKENKLYYEEQLFLDEQENFKRVNCVSITTRLLRKYKFEDKNEIQKLKDIIVYPTEYFCPLDYASNILNITKNTYSIHWYSGAWLNTKDKIKQKCGRIIYGIVGKKKYYQIKRKLLKR